MIYELRKYRIKSGERANWINLMKNEIIPIQQSKGIVIVGAFESLDDPDLFVWIRRFNSDCERDDLQKSLVEDEHWIYEIKPIIRELLVDYQVELLSNVGFSVV